MSEHMSSPAYNPMILLVVLAQSTNPIEFSAQSSKHAQKSSRILGEGDNNIDQGRFCKHKELVKNQL